MSDLYDFEATAANNTTVKLADYKGKVVVLVNTASKCGFTPQYRGLEELYQKYQDRGLVILGFPCNQFGKQEPGDNSEIAQFCELNFGVTFPLMAKIDVNGEATPPLFDYLKSEAPGILGSQSVKWNFTKFLVGRDGKVVKRFAPKDKPVSLTAAIEALL